VFLLVSTLILYKLRNRRVHGGVARTKAVPPVGGPLEIIPLWVANSVAATMLAADIVEDGFSATIK
jgi:hypothetical protein